jgi:hypothetical protein
MDAKILALAALNAARNGNSGSPKKEIVTNKNIFFEDTTARMEDFPELKIGGNYALYVDGTCYRSTAIDDGMGVVTVFEESQAEGCPFYIEQELGNKENTNLMLFEDYYVEADFWFSLYQEEGKSEEWLLVLEDGSTVKRKVIIE